MCSATFIMQMETDVDWDEEAKLRLFKLPGAMPGQSGHVDRSLTGRDGESTEFRVLSHDTAMVGRIDGQADRFTASAPTLTNSMIFWHLISLVTCRERHCSLGAGARV